MIFTQRDEDRLLGLHPHLVKVMRQAALQEEMSFTIVEGLRSLTRQRQLLASHASTTMKSRHLSGHAVDLGVMIGFSLRMDWPLYHRLAPLIKAAASAVSVPIEWGGDWTTFKDGPHWQLPWKEYPL